jgi:hypothetical protein
MTTINTCTSSTRPASPSAGDTLFETDTESLITYDGSAWKSYGADNGNYNLDGTNVTSVRPVLHFDAEFFNGVDTSGNPSNDTSIDTSTVWKSRVGDSYLSQHTASAQPLFKSSGTNSKPYVYCDGGDFLYISRPVLLPTTFTMFAIAEGTSANKMTFFGGTGAVKSSLGASGNLAWIYTGQQYFYFGETGAANASVPLAINGGEMRSHLITRDSSNNTKLHMDGDNVGSMTGTNSDPQLISTVFTGNSNAYRAVGNVYEMMLFGSDLSDADQNALGAYAQAKYGSSNLNWTNF